MKSEPRLATLLCAAICLGALGATGCECWKQYYQSPSSLPLGTASDPVWQNQERNAEASDFVVHEHEFQMDAEWLNLGGEDHVKQIAARLLGGQETPVIVERSMSSPAPGTKYQYPVNPNPELDARRREIIVRSLAAMGIQDADQRVVVAPALTPGITGNEAENIYYQGLGTQGYGATGMRGLGGFGGFMFRGF